LTLPLNVLKGQNVNSRGRSPTVRGKSTFDPDGVAQTITSLPWVSPTAIRVWPLGGHANPSLNTEITSQEVTEETEREGFAEHSFPSFSGQALCSVDSACPCSKSIPAFGFSIPEASPVSMLDAS
jgi:hypothetical protein